MADAFDPYLRWLGIRDPGRPPNHYRLLGLDLFENDSDVIAVAADRQMAHVRTFQTGQFATLSQRLLNELAAARICLLKPEKKAAYDAQLKKQLGGVAVAGRPKPQMVPPAADVDLPNAANPVTGQPGARAVVAGSNDSPSVDCGRAPAGEFPDFASLASGTGPGGRPASSRVRSSPSSKSAASARKSKSLGPWIGLAAAAVLLVVGVIVMQRMSDSPEVASTDGQKSPSPAATGNVAPSTSVPSKTHTDKKPALGSESSIRHDNRPNPSLPAPTATTPDQPAPANIPPGHGDATLPTAVVPAPPKTSPPEPPVRSPQDVIRVENPVQHGPAIPAAVANTPAEVAQANPGKSQSDGGGKTVGPDNPPHSTPKNPAVPVDQGSDSRPKRAPVPSKEQITAAEAKLQKLFNVSAAKKPDERAALAKTLYDQGLDPNNQIIDRFVLLRMATKDAAALGNAELALKAADKLADTFDVNVREEKIGVLATLGKTVRTPSAALAVLGSAQDLSDIALAADDFDAAKSLAQLAAGFAAKSGDAALARQMRQRSIEVDQIKKEYAKAAVARDTLQTQPDDPKANYIWGYYVGLTKGEFDRGLPYLAKGSDTSLVDMATKELAKPTDPKAQAALADGWLEFANSEHEPVRTHVRSHAAEWYSQATGKLTGLEKKRIEGQLARLEPSAKSSIISGRVFLNIITDGSWTINWLPNGNATDPYSKNGMVYKNMVFRPNGTCSNAFHNGTWTQDSPNSVVVRYAGDAALQQRFVLGSKGQLECEYDSPPGRLQNRGVGTKDEARSN